MNTFTRLARLWDPKHLEFLCFCLEYARSYYEGRFRFDGCRDGQLLIDGKAVGVSTILTLLARYYDDTTPGYESALGDMLYLCFTDLVEPEVDLLALLDREVA
jgi:hypothetical protein